MSVSPPQSSPVTEPTGVAPDHRAIVFFDGVCGLCNATVDFMFRHDHRRRLACAPLQGETAERLLPDEIRERLNTLVVRLPDGRQYVRSAAVVRMLWRMGGLWKIAAGGLWLIPLPLRDLGYRCVAALRYRLFGHRETCRMPTAEDRERLLP